MDNSPKMTIAAGLAAPALRPAAVPLRLPDLPPMVRTAPAVAMDSQSVAPLYTWAGQFGCNNSFPGYAALAQLSQISEYRAPVETLAKELTRRWIKLTTRAGSDEADKKSKQAKIDKIDARMRDLNVQDTFRRIAEIDGFFGRAQLWISIKGNDAPLEPLHIDPQTIGVGKLEGFQTIEPIWTSPTTYNATDPTRPDFYKPSRWFVLSRETDASRLLTFISRPVPDMLKPAYNFGGISLTQLMTPYVQDWHSVRDHVAAMLRNYSVWVIKTNMQAILQGDPTDTLTSRVALFNKYRDNNGAAMIDKDSEDIANVSASLSELHALKAQAQENMAAPSHMPLVKLTGITPSGLNASSDGEIQVWYDYIRSEQETFFRPHLTTVLRIIQLDLFGAIDESIDFEFVPLEEPSSDDLAAERKSNADTDAVLIDRGVIAPEESRTRLAADPNSGYTNLSGPAPEPPDLGDPDKPEPGDKGDDE